MSQSKYIFVVAIATSFVAAPLFAVDKTWNAGTGNWSTAANWTPAGIPASGDTANIVFADGVDRTVTYDAPTSVPLDTLQLDLTGGGTSGAVLTISANDLSSSLELVGVAGLGAVNQSGGSNSVALGGLTLGVTSTGKGTYTLDSGNLEIGGVATVGAGGRGVFVQNGGTNNVYNQMFIGSESAASGSYTLNGGLLQVSGDEYLGFAATGTVPQAGGTFVQTGGSHLVNGLVIANGVGSTGAYTLSSGTLLCGSTAYIGGSGSGSLSQTGGSLTGSTIVLGAAAGGLGAYSVSGGIATASNIQIGNGYGAFLGTGVMTISGTNTVVKVSDTITINNAPGSKLTLQSGTLKTRGIVVGATPSHFNWTSGTLEFTENATWDSGGNPYTTAPLFGSSLSLSSSRTLIVDGNESIGGSGAFTLNVGSGATHTVMGDITINPGGTLNQSSNSAIIYTNLVQVGGAIMGTFRNLTNYFYQGGLLSTTFTNDGSATFTANCVIGQTYQNNGQTIVGTGRSFSASILNNQGSFTLNGGSLSSSGTFNNLAGGTLTAHGTIGGITNLGTLMVDGALNLTSSLKNDGMLQGFGSITGPNSPITNRAGGVIGTVGYATTLVIASMSSNDAGGTVNAYSGTTLSITSNWTNSGVVNVYAGGRLSGGVITNGGTLQGAGMITSILTNNQGVIRASGGELDITSSNITNSGQVQAVDGSTAMFLGGMSTNIGTISLTGGTFDNNQRTLANSGTINGYGTIRTGSLSNSIGKVLAVGGGDMNVFGTFANQGVVNIQTGRTIYFYNNVNGSGSFTGGGTAVFLASLSPGNSPATVTFAGGASLIGGTSLVMELGSMSPGRGYDQIQVGGLLSIGGALSVSLLNSFMPTVGMSFDLLDWGSLAGTFSALELPTLANGRQWDTSQLYTTGVLSVVAAPLLGDYNGNGAVDGADYVVWRKGLGTTYVQSDYDVWRANFGQTTGSGTLAAGTAAVPEATTGSMLLVGMITVFARRFRLAF